MMTSQQILDAKLAQIHPTAEERNTAKEVLAGTHAVPECDRVALACLKVAGSDLTKLKECVAAARIDYRDVIAWAEYPRQMALPVHASPTEKTRARREDLDEYTDWINETYAPYLAAKQRNAHLDEQLADTGVVDAALFSRFANVEIDPHASSVGWLQARLRELHIRVQGGQALSVVDPGCKSMMTITDPKDLIDWAERNFPVAGFKG